jgi:hypothetical protein
MKRWHVLVLDSFSGFARRNGRSLIIENISFCLESLQLNLRLSKVNGDVLKIFNALDITYLVIIVAYFQLRLILFFFKILWE